MPHRYARFSLFSMMYLQMKKYIAISATLMRKLTPTSICVAAKFEENKVLRSVFSPFVSPSEMKILPTDDSNIMRPIYAPMDASTTWFLTRCPIVIAAYTARTLFRKLSTASARNSAISRMTLPELG